MQATGMSASLDTESPTTHDVLHKEASTPAMPPPRRVSLHEVAFSGVRPSGCSVSSSRKTSSRVPYTTVPALGGSDASSAEPHGVSVCPSNVLDGWEDTE
eukprot:RCo007901